MKAAFNFLRRTTRAMAPWAILGLVFPGVLVINNVFLAFFPAPGTAQKAFNPFDLAALQHNLVQTTFVYQSKKPDEIFGNFYYALGTQMAARGQMLTAEDLLSKASKLQADNEMALMTYAIVLESLDKNAQALQAYEQVLVLKPNLSQAHYSRGLLLDKLGETDEGIAALKRALELDPKNAYLNYDLGVFYAKKNDYDNSAYYSRKAVESTTDFAEAYNNYAYALSHQAKYEDALNAVNKSLELKPDSAAALDTRGFIYAGMKRFEEALEEYKKALALDPTIGEIYLHMGQAFEQLGQADKAVKSYETYLQLTPEALDRREVEQKIQQMKQSSTAAQPPAQPAPQSK